MDSAALRTHHERITEQHPSGWAERTTAIAATWDVDTIVGMILTDFDRALATAAG